MDFLLTLLILIGIVDGLLLGFLLLAIIHAASKVGTAAAK